MIKKKVNKRVYMKPTCEDVGIKMEILILTTSGNAGTIKLGNSYGEAKRLHDFEDEDLEDSDYSLMD